ncbi:tetratricopeptide repeat protein [Streptomyces flaveolus]|uniref:tetratricopeptide repeat protein n=1 Tax=Streptomyces flaveolus TaxID=67297 RepID=UPI0033A49479
MAFIHHLVASKFFPLREDTRRLLWGLRDRYGVPFITKCTARLRALERDADAEAVKLLAQVSLEEAETWFRAAAENELEAESPLKFMLAEFLARQGRDGEAEGWYRRAALAADGSYDVLSAAERLGDLLSARGAYEEAETWYRRAYYGDDPPGTTEERLLEGPSRPIDFASRGKPGVAHKRAANLGKAGEDSYQAARAMIHRWATTLRRSAALPPVSPPEQAGMEGVVLRISAHVSDEALRQLAALDFTVIRQTMGSAVEVSWDENLHEWKITTLS